MDKEKKFIKKLSDDYFDLNSLASLFISLLAILNMKEFEFLLIALSQNNNGTKFRLAFLQSHIPRIWEIHSELQYPCPVLYKSIREECIGKKE